MFGCDKDEPRSSYQINCMYDETSHSLYCQQSVDYVNTSENAFKAISFNIYANAFREDAENKPVSTSNFEKAYPNGESYGNITIETVKISGQEVDFEIISDMCCLKVYLLEELFPDERVTIDMRYTVNLANINHRLGYGENTINLGNFFPIACVYEEGTGFISNSYVANGDPFYSDVADFNIQIEVPDGYIVACTGKEEEKTSGNKKIITSKASKVRDFCIVMSEKFEILKANADGVLVKYYYFNDENAEEHLQIAVEAVETFSKEFGDYPYETLDVVKADFCFGGMEYPNLIYVSSDIIDNESYNYVIVHEIAHQWWYGVVGNNEYVDSWVDEGLTEFSSALFFEIHDEYGLNYDTIMQNATDSYKLFVQVYKKVLGKVDESMDRNLSEFNTEPEYVNCIYTKGMLMFDNLRTNIGNRKFSTCLKDYYKNYSFKNASAEDLIDSFSKSAKCNLEGFFKAWIKGEVIFN